MLISLSLSLAKSSRSAAVSTLAVVALLSACAGGGDDDASNTLITERAPEDVESICADAFSRSVANTESLIEATCIGQQLTQGDPASCETLAQECVDLVSELQAGAGSVDIEMICSSELGLFAECAVTEQELRACLDDIDADRQSVFSALTCNTDPADVDSSLLAAAFSRPDSCAAIAADCGVVEALAPEVDGVPML